MTDTNIITPNALVQTSNGKRFYVNSGVIQVDDTETAVLDIDNIGERDILLTINPIVSSLVADKMVMNVKNNGFTIFQEMFSQEGHHPNPYDVSFIIPANTSLAITFKNVDSTTHPVGASCYGQYLSMD